MLPEGLRLPVLAFAIALTVALTVASVVPISGPRSEPSEQKPGEQTPSSAEPSPTRNQFMVETLAELLEATQFPDDFTLNGKATVYYQQLSQANAAKIHSLQDQINKMESSSAGPSEQTQIEGLRGQIETLEKELEHYRGKQIFHTLVAGDPQQALAEANSLLDDQKILAGERPPYFEDLADLFELKATMHFVIGEQENCQQNHNPRSCILPLHQDAFHISPTGSEAALEYLQLALEADPKKPASLWLYNLAQMTLGRYPESVPERWRVPFEKYDADLDFPHFTERASGLGVNTHGYLGGASMEDFNGDGLLDLFTTSFKLGENVRLYLNRGERGFEDVTQQAGLMGITGGANTVHADYNNDGHCDILIVRGGWLNNGGKQPNSLLRNEGDGTFTDVTQESGLLSFHPTHSAAWSDFNNDGFLDLFVGNESGLFEENELGATVLGANPPDHFSELFINDQDGSFTEVGSQVGVSVNQWVKGAVWSDFDNDGWPDLYVSCHGAGNLVFKNEGADEAGAVRFTEVGKEVGLDQPNRSFPVACFDYNNDGFQDLFVADYEFSDLELASEYLEFVPPRHPPRLYLNQGDWNFKEVSEQAGLGRSIYAMGLNYGDLNNDGFLDLYAATGHPDPRSLFPNLMFLNDQGHGFLDVTAKGGFGHLQKGHGVAFGDLDNDGDQDVYANVGGFFENDAFWNACFENPGFGNHWVNLKLAGESSNRSAIGARIKLVISESGKQREIHRVVSTGGSYGASSLAQEIGIGSATQIDSLVIDWPTSGQRQEFSDVKADSCYLIRESAQQPQRQTYQPVIWSDDRAHQGEPGHHP